MIICNIQGGLGNQMFQYAMGKSLSLERNTEVKFCIDSFPQYHAHNGFELQRVFGIELPLASPDELKNVLNFGRSHPFMRRALTKDVLKALRGSSYKLDSESGYDSALINSLGSDAYLHGYWQSEKYFSKYADQIRKDFCFSNPLDEINTALIAQIQACNSVSIHIRRGDYVSNPKTFAVHGVCGIDYYQNAIDLAEDQINMPSFFVFTDDAKWAKQELLTCYPQMTIIDHNVGLDSYKDMQLMSACSHHIIANSSFSWWGAWLNPSIAKLVVAPKHWFANGKEAHGLIPPTWKRI